MFKELCNLVNVFSFNYMENRNYKWGIFYFDKSDPRIIVPKQNQMMGFTVNFARPEAYLILVIIFFVAFISGNIK